MMDEDKVREKTAEDRLRERVLLSRAVPGDRLMLADAALLAALDGSRPLSTGELAALNGSPVTLRRFRHLALERRRGAWTASTGMLRAADSGELTLLATDDGLWTLHFVVAEGWQVILKLEVAVAAAPQLLRERPLLRVTDGGGAIVLQGRLDSDGECERSWPFEAAPAQHFQACGATFAVTALG
ncbi:hypothetical protein IP91_00644 [Pseudoduganella lurida]|uniref:Uncharacterized protein n=1 Tax=Pseudoduganella lurida TaxID=1036180 RepID=A0A562RLU0_9BURK|nr:hypothetical protein [Pseudoduganella lurida]TWI69574.1 hypothetical protein IP91_00644 [Pseudoduganella lurida]